MTGISLEICSIQTDQQSQRSKDMPTVCRELSPSNAAMTSSFNLSSKQNHNTSHINGFFQSRSLSLARHIETLKSAANAPLLFPDLNNNSNRPITSLLSIANSGEFTDVSPLRSRPPSSNWAIDPLSVPGNLRNQHHADKTSISKNESNLTVEEILSRGSSVSEKVSEIEDGILLTKSCMKAGRKISKTQKRKREAISRKLSDSPLAKTNLLSTSIRLSQGTLQSKSVHSKDVDALSALCKGITIQEKATTNAHSKLPSHSRKSSITQAAQKSNAKTTAQTISITKLGGSSGDSKSTVITLDQPRRRKSLNKSEDIKTVKVFQSDQQSGVISDLGLTIPCAPPATPTAEQLRRFEYVPSLQDVRAQRAFRQRLQAMESKASQKEMKKQENLMAVEKLSIKEKRQQLKRSQRLQIYALNKIMTELEYQRFQTFMQGVGSGIS